jgi:hypothetical protein
VAFGANLERNAMGSEAVEAFLREVMGGAKDNRAWTIEHTIGESIVTRAPIKVGETLGIVRGPMNISGGSQRFGFCSMICICRDGRVNVDASQKTGLRRFLIVILMLHRVSEKVAETDDYTHKSVLTEQYLLLGE